MYSRTIFSPSFSNHILGIFFWGSQKPMFRILTRRIVTQMTHIFSIRYFPKHKFVTKPMRTYGFMLNTKFPITIFRFIFTPFPTLTIFSPIKRIKISLFNCFRHPKSVTMSFKSFIMERTKIFSYSASIITIINYTLSSNKFFTKPFCSFNNKRTSISSNSSVVFYAHAFSLTSLKTFLNNTLIHNYNYIKNIFNRNIQITALTVSNV